MFHRTDISDPIVPSCRATLGGEILVASQIHLGRLHGHHPKLPILREAESYSTKASGRHRTMRRLQEPAASDGRAGGGEPRGVRRNCSRQQSPCPGGFLGGMVWSV